MKITVLVAAGVSIAAAVAVAVVVGMALDAAFNVAMPVAVAAAAAHYTIAVANLTECFALFPVQIYLLALCSVIVLPRESPLTRCE